MNDEMADSRTEDLNGASGPEAVCAICGHDYEFEMPKPLLEAVKAGRLVVFAGAGISTEGGSAFPSTLYDEIKAQLPKGSASEAFPEVMAEYEELHGRLKLVEEITARLRYAETFPAVRSVAARFHGELAPITPIRDIITTNWDVFFEDECGAIPIVVGGDYAFYNLPNRKVYKIHGSLRNVSTLIATTEDYREAEASLRESAVGGTLRHLLATKVVVFIGYSLRDADFRNVYEPLMGSMGKLRPLSYFVGPFESEEAKTYGLRQIQTDGTHFLRSLRAHLIEDGLLLADQAFSQSQMLREVVLEAHSRTSDMSWRDHSELFFSLAYQDGMLDALNRIGSQWATGEYADRKHVVSVVRSYDHLLHIAIERDRYWDAAYINGYSNGVLALLMEFEELSDLPLYEFFEHKFYFDEPLQLEAADEGEGRDKGFESPPNDSESGFDTEPPDDFHSVPPTIMTQAEVLGELSGVFERLPAAGAEAGRHLRNIPEGMIPQHTPFLDGVIEHA